jgi:xylan 1,4-beta-xylosidase
VARGSDRLRSALALLAAVLAGACAPAAHASPALPGDHPDPSLLRAGDGWFATSTSDDWLPAFPILHSTDLAHWRQVGAVLPRRPSWATRDFWAPELVRRGGRVLVYYAARARDGKRCIAVASAAGVRGPYGDNGPLLCSRVGEIDPLPVRDEQGADWLVWKRDGNSRGRPTPILAAPLAPGGLSLAAPPRELFRADAPWEHDVVEAPALLRHDGTFYLLYSGGHCCGRNCNYATGVARSASLLGPWEKRRRPILTGGGAIRCPGHVGIAHGAAGEPLLAYHAYVRGDSSNRRLQVEPIGFDAAGWPRVERERAPATRPPAARFGFDTALDAGWEWPAGRRPPARVAGGRLVLGSGALARQAGATRFAATAVVSPGRGARPGLAVMGSEGNTVGIELRGARAVAWRSEEGRRTEVGAIALPPGRPVAAAGRIVLRLTVGRRVRLAVGTRGRWRAIGEPQRLPRWAGGARVALTVSGAARARVDSLALEPR